MLTPEQTKQIKNELLRQIESWPAEQQESAKEQLEAMNQEQFEEFLEKNNILKPRGSAPVAQPANLGQSQQCIFCSIIQGQTKSYKIDENKQAIAILEINPISNGHVLIIPREHTTTDKLPNQALSLAKKIAKKIRLKLKPKEVEIATSSIMGHALINVIPIYGGETAQSERKKANEQELAKLQAQLKKKKRTTLKPKTKKSSNSAIIKIPRRIP